MSQFVPSISVSYIDLASQYADLRASAKALEPAMIATYDPDGPRFPGVTVSLASGPKTSNDNRALRKAHTAALVTLSELAALAGTADQRSALGRDLVRLVEALQPLRDTFTATTNGQAAKVQYRGTSK